MKKINNLTVVIVTYLTEKKILLNCLQSIDKKTKVIIVENSKSFKNKNYFIKKFSNIEVVCTGLNLGYGNGNNFGLNKVKTDYALILNPDIICKADFFKNASKLIYKTNKFSIVGCQYSNDTAYLPAGFFDVKKHNNFKKNFYKNKKKLLTRVDWVTGCSMLINLKKYENRNIFDKNYFLYFEEFDLCKSTSDKGGFVYSSSDLKVLHLGFKGSLGASKLLTIEANRLRDWHWMWSYFYFYKKNYNYFYALFKISGKFFKSFLKTIFYTLVFNQVNRDKYLFRFLGLLFSIIGFKSNYRGKRFY
ncbi:glycosyltransferase [Candidatus Pelagibacter sp.]|jgi:N-acetylglucosaminyl-diphospho-decaprenol L-rhamnosyltransferase|nr:glycosyltransferase [Candidatus Pelagibacter sp.]|tara:strand:- start:504 stop:1415 length:912 start_codon:yes stop_codon:yes gene_type:complete